MLQRWSQLQQLAKNKSLPWEHLFSRQLSSCFWWSFFTVFFHLFSSVIQLNLYVCVCVYCIGFTSILLIKCRQGLEHNFKLPGKCIFHEQSHTSSMSSFKRTTARFYVLLKNRCLIELLSPLFWSHAKCSKLCNCSSLFVTKIMNYTIAKRGFRLSRIAKLLA